MQICDIEHSMGDGSSVTYSTRFPTSHVRHTQHLLIE
jgi:hypothetical protein